MNYSANDIIRMRRAAYALATPIGVSYNSHKIALEVEAQLVTYMAAGVTPDDLESEVEAARKKWEEEYLRKRERDAFKYGGKGQA